MKVAVLKFEQRFFFFIIKSEERLKVSSILKITHLFFFSNRWAKQLQTTLWYPYKMLTSSTTEQFALQKKVSSSKEIISKI